ncbi:hypothetical protein [Brevibacillus parabrevis]|jgi:hypothetical protein|uniref:hypothetical protein n=1 Tax=Brevibacillus parabrevis TaxID=54914 RepID=UPI0024908267|nr:hypothetical protein [Brevibacillus parabrevis]
MAAERKALRTPLKRSPRFIQGKRACYASLDNEWFAAKTEEAQASAAEEVARKAQARVEARMAAKENGKPASA